MLKKFRVPVTFEVFGEVEVEAESREEAIRAVRNKQCVSVAETFALPEGFTYENHGLTVFSRSVKKSDV